jgi:hypothetical protein
MRPFLLLLAGALFGTTAMAAGYNDGYCWGGASVERATNEHRGCVRAPLNRIRPLFFKSEYINESSIQLELWLLRWTR